MMKINALLCIFLVAATLTVYWQVGGNTFINFDDNAYVVKNPNVATGLTGDNIVWAFTQTHAANWHPLTWLSHMLDCQFYGLDPRGHHLTNVLIHALSTLLLFLLLVQITGVRWQGFTVAALFALHPLHVESVAWIAERKDILSGFFWILTLHLYVRYVQSSNRNIYILTICSFVLGLMAKSMLVTLPMVMLLLDYWPLCRFRQLHQVTGDHTARSSILRSLVKEKIPFLFFSLLSSVITIYAQKVGESVVSLKQIPLGLRLENAFVAYAQYVIKMFLPYDLAIFYPFRTLPLWQVLISLLLLASVSQQAYRLRTRFPYILIGWLWFLITLLPVIGLVQVGDQSMADRYTYMPYIGLFIMLSWGMSDIMGKCKYHAIALTILASTVIAICCLLTNHQLAYWKNNTALFTHAINVTSDNFKAHHALGVVLAKRGNFEEAFKHFSTAIRIVPDAVIPYYDMGVALEASGRANEAALYYLRVISMNPEHFMAHTQLGGILCREGQYKDAFTHFSTAIQLKPNYYSARFDFDKCISSLKK